MSDSQFIKSLALVGSPNCGKTTLYNWLTDSQFKTVNYPGATVEYSLGNLADDLTQAPEFSELKKRGLRVMDTPGTYSLHPKSHDEEVTLKALYQNPEFGRVDAVLVVVDGTQIKRHLLIAQQVRETGFPMMIVITMADLLKKQELNLDLEVLRKEFQCPVVLFEGVMAGGMSDVLAAISSLKTSNKVLHPQQWSEKILVEKVTSIQKIAVRALSKNDPAQSSSSKLSQIFSQTHRLDRFLLHPFFGILIFFFVMSGLFTSIYWLAAPVMDLVEAGFKLSQDFVLGQLGETLVGKFLGNGIIASFSSVLVFVPQIFILFLGIGLLESTGYLARAATLIDKPFSKMGMSGRSFVPVLSGFACAVPAIMATRNIASKRDRLITTMVIPLMACSARLPVYALLISFLWRDQPAWKAGLTLAGLYLGALVIGSLAAGILNRIVSRHGELSSFMMELPLYRLPRLKVIVNQSVTRTFSYVKRAGPIIFGFAVLMWVGTTFPNYSEKDAHTQLETSYLGKAGKVIEPIFEPMGMDWRAGVGLVSAFAAREVFVSTLAVVMNITSEDEAERDAGLLGSMSEAVNSDGKKIFTGASVAGLIFFFMIALQCISTYSIVVREMGSVKLALLQLVVFNVVAYVGAVVINQVFG